MRPAYTGWASHDDKSRALADSPSQSRHRAGPAIVRLADAGAAMTRTAVTIAELAAQLRAGGAAEVAAAAVLLRELHGIAEPSGSEHQTAATVAAALGAPDAEVVAETGRLVRIGSPDGPCVALRAELDALPITEQTGVAWASRNGAMHACGHDVHLAALTAVGRAARAGGPALPCPVLADLPPTGEAIPEWTRDSVAS